MRSIGGIAEELVGDVEVAPAHESGVVLNPSVADRNDLDLAGLDVNELGLELNAGAPSVVRAGDPPGAGVESNGPVRILGHGDVVAMSVEDEVVGRSGVNGARKDLFDPGKGLSTASANHPGRSKHGAVGQGDDALTGHALNRTAGSGGSKDMPGGD